MRMGLCGRPVPSGCSQPTSPLPTMSPSKWSFSANRPYMSAPPAQGGLSPTSSPSGDAALRPGVDQAVSLFFFPPDPFKSEDLCFPPCLDFEPQKIIFSHIKCGKSFEYLI